MSLGDQRRWDKKWKAMVDETIAPHELLVNNFDLLSAGDALDLACGRGQNAMWLAERGYQVRGLDISVVALEMAQAEAVRRGLSEQVRFERMDLDNLSLPSESYDLICVFHYLDRSLFPVIRQGLRPEGLLFFSTRHLGFLKRQPKANRAYLLRPGELMVQFADWQLLHVEEGPENSELIARKAGKAQ